MLDVKKLKINPEKFKKAMHSRTAVLDEKIDEIINLDSRRLETLKKVEEMQAEQNAMSKKIPELKKNGQNSDELMKNLKVLSENIAKKNNNLAELEKQQKDLLLQIPNIPHESVPVGKDDDNNKEIRRFGETPDFKFEAKAHWEIGKNLGIISPEIAAKVTGSRFHFYKGVGSRLERAIVNFFLNTHTGSGYTEIFPPFIVNKESMVGTGQLPKFEEDMFRISDSDYYLIPTAEVPVTNMHRGDVLDFKNLPLKYCAYSSCFRAEAGSAGRDTRGLIRQHQFNKVELVKFCSPETSYEELESLTLDAEKVLKLLGLPYRVVALSTGDLGFCSAKTYDIEVWMPSYKRYVEISSCSNFESFQSRRTAIRFKKDIKSKAVLVHTLNGSGVAVGRTFAAILENFQTSEGFVKVPEVLQDFMGTDLIKHF
ncbi:serine--tRNA ligase [Clostridia bacterium]|nr:serine--tRNA ligase [Clostridia bacterium]